MTDFQMIPDPKNERVSEANDREVDDPRFLRERSFAAPLASDSAALQGRVNSALDRLMPELMEYRRYGNNMRFPDAVNVAALQARLTATLSGPAPAEVSPALAALDKPGQAFLADFERYQVETGTSIRTPVTERARMGSERSRSGAEAELLQHANRLCGILADTFDLVVQLQNAGVAITPWKAITGAAEEDLKKRLLPVDAYAPGGSRETAVPRGELGDPRTRSAQQFRALVHLETLTSRMARDALSETLVNQAASLLSGLKLTETFMAGKGAAEDKAGALTREARLAARAWSACGPLQTLLKRLQAVGTDLRTDAVENGRTDTQEGVTKARILKTFADGGVKLKRNMVAHGWQAVGLVDWAQRLRASMGQALSRPNLPGVDEAVSETGLGLLDRIQQMQAGLGRIYTSAQRLVQATEAHLDAANAWSARTGGILNDALSTQAVHWREKAQEEQLTLAVMVAGETGLADESAAAVFLSQLRLPLSLAPQDPESVKVTSAFDTQVKSAVSRLSDVARKMTGAVRLAGHGAEGNRELGAVLWEANAELGRLKGEVKKALVIATGDVVHNFSRDGMMARRIAEQLAPLREEWIGSGRSEESYEDAFTQGLRERLPMLTNNDSKAASDLQARTRLEVVNAAAGRTQYPATMGEMLAALKSTDEAVYKWAHRRLIRAVMGLGLFRTMKSGVNLATLPARLSLKVVITGARVALAAHQGARHGRVGQGSSGYEAKEYAKREFTKLAVKTVLTLPPFLSSVLGITTLVLNYRSSGLEGMAKEIARELIGEAPWLGLDAGRRAAAVNWVRGAVNVEAPGLSAPELAALDGVIKAEDEVPEEAGGGPRTEPGAAAKQASAYLTRIAASSDLRAAELARALMRKPGLDDVTFESGASSFYDSGRHTISLRADAPDGEILHEIAHALTVKQLRYGLKHPSSEAGRLRSRLDALRIQALKGPGGARAEFAYRLGNVTEFVAGVYEGDEAFMRYLGGLPAEGESVLSVLVKILCGLLGVDEESVLGETLGLSQQLMGVVHEKDTHDKEEQRDENEVRDEGIIYGSGIQPAEGGQSTLPLTKHMQRERTNELRSNNDRPVGNNKWKPLATISEMTQMEVDLPPGTRFRYRFNFVTSEGRSVEKTGFIDIPSSELKFRDWQYYVSWRLLQIINEDTNLMPAFMVSYQKGYDRWQAPSRSVFNNMYYMPDSGVSNPEFTWQLTGPVEDSGNLQPVTGGESASRYRNRDDVSVPRPSRVNKWGIKWSPIGSFNDTAFELEAGTRINYHFSYRDAGGKLINIADVIIIPEEHRLKGKWQKYLADKISEKIRKEPSLNGNATVRRPVKGGFAQADASDQNVVYVNEKLSYAAFSWQIEAPVPASTVSEVEERPAIVHPASESGESDEGIMDELIDTHAEDEQSTLPLTKHMQRERTNELWLNNVSPAGDDTWTPLATITEMAVRPVSLLPGTRFRYRISFTASDGRSRNITRTITIPDKHLKHGDWQHYVSQSINSRLKQDTSLKGYFKISFQEASDNLQLPRKGNYNNIYYKTDANLQDPKFMWQLVGPEEVSNNSQPVAQDGSASRYRKRDDVSVPRPSRVRNLDMNWVPIGSFNDTAFDLAADTRINYHLSYRYYEDGALINVKGVVIIPEEHRQHGEWQKYLADQILRNLNLSGDIEIGRPVGGELMPADASDQNVIYVNEALSYPEFSWQIQDPVTALPVTTGDDQQAPDQNHVPAANTDSLDLQLESMEAYENSPRATQSSVSAREKVVSTAILNSANRRHLNLTEEDLDKKVTVTKTTQLKPALSAIGGAAAEAGGLKNTVIGEAIEIIGETLDLLVNPLEKPVIEEANEQLRSTPAGVSSRDYTLRDILLGEAEREESFKLGVDEEYTYDCPEKPEINAFLNGDNKTLPVATDVQDELMVSLDKTLEVPGVVEGFRLITMGQIINTLINRLREKPAPNDEQLKLIKDFLSAPDEKKLQLVKFADKVVPDVYAIGEGNNKILVSPKRKKLFFYTVGNELFKVITTRDSALLDFLKEDAAEIDSGEFVRSSSKNTLIGVAAESLTQSGESPFGTYNHEDEKIRVEAPDKDIFKTQYAAGINKIKEDLNGQIFTGDEAKDLKRRQQIQALSEVATIALTAATLPVGGEAGAGFTALTTALGLSASLVDIYESEQEANEADRSLARAAALEEARTGYLYLSLYLLNPGVFSAIKGAVTVQELDAAVVGIENEATGFNQAVREGTTSRGALQTAAPPTELDASLITSKNLDGLQPGTGNFTGTYKSMDNGFASYYAQQDGKVYELLYDKTSNIWKVRRPGQPRFGGYHVPVRYDSATSKWIRRTDNPGLAGGGWGRLGRRSNGQSPGSSITDYSTDTSVSGRSSGGDSSPVSNSGGSSSPVSSSRVSSSPVSSSNSTMSSSGTSTRAINRNSHEDRLSRLGGTSVRTNTSRAQGTVRAKNRYKPIRYKTNIGTLTDGPISRDSNVPRVSVLREDRAFDPNIQTVSFGGISRGKITTGIAGLDETGKAVIDKIWGRNRKN